MLPVVSAIIDSVSFFWNRSFAPFRSPSFFFRRPTPRPRNCSRSFSQAAAAHCTALHRRSSPTRNLHHRCLLEQVSLPALLHCKPFRVLAAHRVPRRRSYDFRRHAMNAEGKLARLVLHSVPSCSFSSLRSCLLVFLSSMRGGGLFGFSGCRSHSFFPRRF